MLSIHVNTCGSSETEKSIICLIKDNSIVEYKKFRGTRSHSEEILQIIDNILNKNKIKLSDIDFFGVLSGPGSYTGIRVGVSVVNTLAYLTKKPVMEYNYYDLMQEFAVNELGFSSNKLMLLKRMIRNVVIIKDETTGEVKRYDLDQEPVDKLPKGDFVAFDFDRIEALGSLEVDYIKYLDKKFLVFFADYVVKKSKNLKSGKYAEPFYIGSPV